ncbi:MAG: TlpA disulfide reductase family protein [Pseudomonadota bacterium]
MPAALILVGLSAAALLYVVFMGASKPPAVVSSKLAVGAMSKLEVLAQPPKQSALALLDSEGHSTSLAAFHGKVILVNFWATWCTPCMNELPTLAALQRRYQGPQFGVVTVNIDADSSLPEARSELARLSGGALPFISDPSRSIEFDAQAKAMPTSILYDTQGREVARVTGDVDWTKPEANALIDTALGRS